MHVFILSNLAKHVMQPWCWDFNTNTISGWIQKHPQKVLLIQNEEEQQNENNMPPQSHAQEHSSTWLSDITIEYTLITLYYHLFGTWRAESLPKSFLSPQLAPF